MMFTPMSTVMRRNEGNIACTAEKECSGHIVQDEPVISLPAHDDEHQYAEHAAQGNCKWPGDTPLHLSDFIWRV